MRRKRGREERKTRGEKFFFDERSREGFGQLAFLSRQRRVRRRWWRALSSASLLPPSAGTPRIRDFYPGLQKRSRAPATRLAGAQRRSHSSSGGGRKVCGDRLRAAPPASRPTDTPLEEEKKKELLIAGFEKESRFRPRKRLLTAAQQGRDHSTSARSKWTGKERLDSHGESTRRVPGISN